MSVDFYICKSCEKTFADCGDYVSCEKCGNVWCSDECAKKDGYREQGCILDRSIIISYDNHENECPLDKEHCYECENSIEMSCSFCRNEKLEDEELLVFIIKKYDLDKDIETKECLKRNKKEGNNERKML